MKLRALTLFLFVVLAACGKANDVNAVQDEATGVVAMYRPVVDRLELRLKRLDKTALGPAADLKTKAEGKMAALRRELTDAPGKIAMHGSGSNARWDLVADRDSFRRNLDRGVTEVTAYLEQIDSWIAAQTYPRPAVVAPEPTPTPEPTPPEPDPTLENEGAGSGSAPAGSGSAR